jgi:hypothetical protein
MRTIVTSAALLALAGCGSGGEQAREAERRDRAAPADTTIVTPQAKAELRSGAGAMAALPAGLPAYPGAESTGGVEVTGASAEGSGGIVGFRTADSPARVVDFYAAAAERAGYRIAQRSSFGTTAMLTAQRGEGEVLNVTATETGGATQVQIIAGGSAR